MVQMMNNIINESSRTPQTMDTIEYDTNGNFMNSLGPTRKPNIINNDITLIDNSSGPTVYSLFKRNSTPACGIFALRNKWLYILLPPFSVFPYINEYLSYAVGWGRIQNPK